MQRRFSAPSNRAIVSDVEVGWPFSVGGEPVGDRPSLSVTSAARSEKPPVTMNPAKSPLEGRVTPTFTTLRH